ncbi:helix-turn-helix domain-containing protein [Blastococcus mobilis]|uniref:helix-turn-helix domain-containing protein n=1 Tax=Blastococcus mobilis TaxID=1938746 RepID=UPI0034A0B2B6
MRQGGGGELERVRALRQRGLSPKEIARALGLPPSRVTRLSGRWQRRRPPTRPGVRWWSAG